VHSHRTVAAIVAIDAPPLDASGRGLAFCGRDANQTGLMLREPVPAGPAYYCKVKFASGTSEMVSGMCRFRACCLESPAWAPSRNSDFGVRVYG
jgi:hypothetical protein